MKIISHRGYWKTPAEKNTDLAFRRSFDLGFGTETDVRDALGELVISHDMPQGGEITLESFLSLPNCSTLPLAMNIKADGLARPLQKAMAKANVKDWFVFDMSVPDTRGHLEVGNPVFVRMSEVERQPPWIDLAAGIWLDSFGAEWYSADDLRNWLDKWRVCVVSSELHGRIQLGLWEQILSVKDSENLILCTDLPEDAANYFGKTYD